MSDRCMPDCQTSQLFELSILCMIMQLQFLSYTGNLKFCTAGICVASHNDSNYTADLFVHELNSFCLQFLLLRESGLSWERRMMAHHLPNSSLSWMSFWKWTGRRWSGRKLPGELLRQMCLQLIPPHFTLRAMGSGSPSRDWNTIPYK